MAALCQAYGGDGWALLTERDPDALVIRQALAVRAAEVAQRRDDRLAATIARRLAGKK